MLAISLDTAKNIAIVAATASVILAVVAAWMMKTLITKLLVAGLFALLAFVIWSNRTTLQDCADKVVADVQTVGSGDTECTFFGVTVTVPVPST